MWLVTPPTYFKGIISCGFCESAMTNSHTNKSGKKYFYYKCSSKNKGLKLKAHNPKDLPYQTVDEFTVLTIKAFLAEPEMMEAFMKRSVNETTERITNTEELLKQIRSNRLQLVKAKERVSQDLIKGRNFKSHQTLGG